MHPWCSKPTHRYPIRPTYSITVLHPSEMVLFGVKVIFGVIALHKKSSFSSCKAIFVFLASGLLSTSRVDQNFSAFESRLPVCELSQNVQLYFLKSEKEISGRAIFWGNILFCHSTRNRLKSRLETPSLNILQKDINAYIYICDVHIHLLLKTFYKIWLRHIEKQNIWVEQALLCTTADKENADSRRSRKWVKLLVGKK